MKINHFYFCWMSNKRQCPRQIHEHNNKILIQDHCIYNNIEYHEILRNMI